MAFNRCPTYLPLFSSLFISLRFPTFVIRNGARRKCDRTLRIAKGEQRKGSRKEERRVRKAHGGMFRANRRDSAPASIPRSSRQISTDEFPASCIPLRRVLSRNFSRVKRFSVLFDQVDWQTRLFPTRVCLSQIHCYFLSFDMVSGCRNRYLENCGSMLSYFCWKSYISALQKHPRYENRKGFKYPYAEKSDEEEHDVNRSGEK